MIIEKKEISEGSFAQKGTDIVSGDVVTILDGGKEQEGQFGKQFVFKIMTKNGEKLMSFNQTSLNSLVDEFGQDSTGWINKKVKVHSVKQNIQGKFVDVYYVAPSGYELTEFGFVKSQQTQQNNSQT